MTDLNNIPTPNDRKVLVIGWDAADWRVIEPMIAEDKLPNLKAFMEAGVYGNNSTLNPVLSPMLWTSIATGKRPYKHGIHGFSEPTPDGKSVRPITNISRKTKAIWNMMHQCGKKVNVVGWWPSHPAEPINGVMVSNHFQRAGKLHGVEPDAEIGKPRAGQFGWNTKEWPMQPGTVHPPEMAKNIAEFRYHPMELDAEHLGPFVPNLAKIDQKKDKRLQGIAKTLCDTVTIHGAATALMQLEPWDLMCVYYDGIDHFSHGFMKYHPPRQKWVSEKDFENYKDVVEGSYRFHDMMLGAMVELAGKETTIIILSDHGFHPDHLRPQNIPAEPAGPAIEHRPYGVFLMKGPGIRKNERIHGASVLDLCPTVLSLFDLPVGRDMDGKPLINAFEIMPEVKLIDSWDNIEGENGMHPANARLDAVESAEAMKQLVELGYIEEPNEDQDEAVRETVRELKYNLAQAYMDGGRYSEAVPLFESIWNDWGYEHRFGLNLIACFGALGKTDARLEAIRQLAKNTLEYREKALDELESLQKEADEYNIKLPRVEIDKEGNRRLTSTENSEKKDGDDDAVADEAEESKNEKEAPPKLMFKIRKTMALLQPMDGVFAWLEATHAIETGQGDRAIPFLEQIAGLPSETPGHHNQVGYAFLKVDRFADARAAFERALETDAENAAAHLGVAKSAVATRDWDAAIEHALTATELLYVNPVAHLALGQGFMGTDNIEMAKTAMSVALSQAPGFIEAREAMAELLETKLDDAEGAAIHRKAAEQTRKAATELSTPKELDLGEVQASIDERRANRTVAKGNNEDWSDVPTDSIITIVSGLPRSGTSMMMQMLDRGGIDPYTDGQREADPDNPKGYLEHEKATQLGRDRSWLPEVQGKSVKIMAQLLPMLPRNQKYRIVFMDRDLREIARSQAAMLERMGSTGGDLSDAKLMSTLDAHVAGVERWMSNSANVQCCFVDYHAVLADPAAITHTVNAFLGGKLDEQAMCSAVDPKLRRQRSND